MRLLKVSTCVQDRAHGAHLTGVRKVCVEKMPEGPPRGPITRVGENDTCCALEVEIFDFLGCTIWGPCRLREDVNLLCLSEDGWTRVQFRLIKGHKGLCGIRVL